MARPARLALIALSVVVTAPVVTWVAASAYGWINRAVAREVPTCDGTGTRGRFWFINLANVSWVSIRNRKAIVQGYVVKGFPFGAWRQEPASAERELPEVETQEDLGAWRLFSSKYRSHGTGTGLEGRGRVDSWSVLRTTARGSGPLK